MKKTTSFRQYSRVSVLLGLDQNVKKIKNEMTTKDKEKDHEMHFHLARTYKMMNNHEKYVQELEKVLTISPNYHPANYCMGRIHQKKFEYEKAISFFRKARMDPVVGERASYRRGECNHNIGRLGYSLSYWGEYPTFRSEKYRMKCLFRLTYHNIVNRNVPKARHYVEELRELVGKEKNLLVRSLEIVVSVLEKKVIPEEGLRSLIESVGLEKREKESFFHYLNFLVLKVCSVEKYARMLKELDRCLGCSNYLYHNSAFYRVQKALVLSEKFEFNKAEKEIEYAKLEIHPKDVYSHHSIYEGIVYTKYREFCVNRTEEKLNECLKMCENLLREEGEKSSIKAVNPRILILIATIFSEHKDWLERGLEIVKRLNVLVPSCGEIKFLHGKFNFLLSQEKEAVDMFEQAIQLDGCDWRTYLYLGKLYHQRSDFFRGLEYYQKSFELCSNGFSRPIDKCTILFCISQCYLRVGNNKEKNEYLGKGFEIIEKENLNDVKDNYFLLSQYYFSSSSSNNELEKSYTFLKKLGELKKKFEEDKEYYNLLSRILVQMKEKDKILEFYEKYIVDSNEEYYIKNPTICSIAFCLVIMDEAEIGKELITSLLEKIEDSDVNEDERLHWNYCLTLQAKAKIHLHLKEYETASLCFQKCLRAVENHRKTFPHSERFIDRKVIDFTFPLCLLFEETKEFEKAIFAYNAIIKKETERMEKEKLGRRSEYYILAQSGRGNCNLKLENLEEAIEDLVGVYDDNDPRTWIHPGAVGVLFSKMRKDQKAIVYFNIVINHLGNKEDRERIKEEDANSQIMQMESISEENLMEKLILYKKQRGFSFYNLNMIEDSTKDLQAVMDYYVEDEKRIRMKEMFLRVLEVLGYAYLKLKSKRSIPVFTKLIEMRPGNAGYIGRCRSYFLDPDTMRLAINDLITACEKHKGNEMEKKGIVQSLLKIIRKTFSRQIEIEHLKSTEFFEFLIKQFESTAYKEEFFRPRFKITFKDDEEKFVYFHPLFCLFSSYLRELVLKDEYQMELDSSEDRYSVLVIRDWIMGMGVKEVRKNEMIHDLKKLKRTFLVARKFKLINLMNFIVQGCNPLVLQEIRKNELPQMKEDLLDMALGLTKDNETECLLFKTCFGYFKYLYDLDSRKTKLKLIDSDEKSSVPRNSDFIFKRLEKYEENSDEYNNLKKLIGLIEEEEMSTVPINPRPIDYLRKHIVNHKNYRKKKHFDSSSLYEAFLKFLYEKETDFRNVIIESREGGETKYHAEILIASSKFFRENIKINLIKKNEVARLKLEEVPAKVIEVFVDFVYRERFFVKKFDLGNWSDVEFSELLRFCEKFEFQRLEIVLKLKYLKNYTKDW